MDSLKRKFGKKQAGENFESTEYVPLVNLHLPKDGAESYNSTMRMRYETSPFEICRSAVLDNSIKSRSSANTEHLGMYNTHGERHSNLEFNTFGSKRDSGNNEIQVSSKVFAALRNSTTAKGNFQGLNKLLSGEKEPKSAAVYASRVSKHKGSDAQLFGDTMKQSKSYVKLSNTIGSNRSKKSNQMSKLIHNIIFLYDHIGKPISSNQGRGSNTKPAQKLISLNSDFGKRKVSETSDSAGLKYPKHKLNANKSIDIFEQRMKTNKFKATVTTGKNYISFTFRDFK